MKNNDIRAFPLHEDLIEAKYMSQKGMTLRDYFAAQAISGWNKQMVAYEWGEDVMDKAAKVAYRIADAMLKARGE